MKVMRDGRPVTVEVSADGAGLVSHTGTALVRRSLTRWGSRRRCRYGWLRSSSGVAVMIRAGVTFTVDSSSQTVCSIAGSVVSLNADGTCTIDANQAGNTDYQPAPQIQQSFAVRSAHPRRSRAPRRRRSRRAAPARSR